MLFLSIFHDLLPPFFVTLRVHHYEQPSHPFCKVYAEHRAPEYLIPSMKTPIPVIKQNPPKETETARMPRSSILIPATTPTTAIRKTLISSSAAQRAAQSRTMRMLIRIGGSDRGWQTGTENRDPDDVDACRFFSSLSVFLPFPLPRVHLLFCPEDSASARRLPVSVFQVLLITACSFSGPASAKYSVKYSIASS